MSADKPDDTRTHETGFAALWSSDGVTRSMSPTATGMPADLPFLFSAGQHFGAYEIVRPIGKGGMGQVYEAEETDSGRRVALKLLSRGLGDDEERQRFLREGQLAASLSHPHCVYVFGTSEIQGFPIIVMELVPEGTLKDLVVPGTPLAAAAAADALLQVIAGLEAAANIGILHRDVKPSNCFVHRDGRVLVGDFGLSVAAASHDAKGGGTILGTPGFASPEQLRGDSLDVRSDIYSVGATLFYLLAGRAPFDDRSTTALLARVAAEPPPLLTEIRPDLPRGLANIVSRCLAKTPAERFASYAALRTALEPFASTRLAPAPIVRRALAGTLDSWITGLPLIPFGLFLRLQPLSGSHRADALLAGIFSLVVITCYYGLLEGLLGTSAGKALFGLRVVDAHQVAPGFRRASLRAMAFAVPPQLLKQSAAFLLLRAIPDLSVGFISAVAGFIWLVALFSTARKKNGYTALHDRFTATRVVRRRVKVEARDRAERTLTESAAGFAGGARIGPYLVPPSTALAVRKPARIEAFDDRLKRRVWIELLPDAAPPLDASRRDLGRSTRLRWLAGRRETGECWDAYEAVDGAALLSGGAVHPWSQVRHWLADLTHEIVAGLADGSLPPLDPSRVWLGRDGHVRILEWTPPGTIATAVTGPGGPEDLASAQRFLYGACVAALSGRSFAEALAAMPETPLPLSARALLLSLRDKPFASGDALTGAVSAALETPAVYPRSRRSLQVAASAALPVLMTITSIGAIAVLQNSKKTDGPLFKLDACLNELERTERLLRRGPDPKAQQQHDDVEIYLAEHMAGAIQDPETWEKTIPNLNVRGGRDRARHALAAHPARTPEEVHRADSTVAELFDDEGVGLAKLMTWRTLSATTIAIFGGTFVMIAFFAAIGALALGSGFSFRPFGAALVNRRGQRISRLRAVWRALLTWSPVIATGAALKYGPKVTEAGNAWLLLELALIAVMTAAAVWAVFRPARGLQDRIAGTWIVPR